MLAPSFTALLSLWVEWHVFSPVSLSPDAGGGKTLFFEQKKEFARESEWFCRRGTGTFLVEGAGAMSSPILFLIIFVLFVTR